MVYKEINQRLKCIVDYLKGRKIVYNQKDFADKIGKSKTQLSEMLSGKLSISERTVRNIVSAFPFLNECWLLTGEGEMLLPPKNDFSQISSEEIGRVVSESFTEYLLELYQKGEIFPAAVVEKMIAEKDEKIAQLQRRVWELENN